MGAVETQSILRKSGPLGDVWRVPRISQLCDEFCENGRSNNAASKTTVFCVFVAIFLRRSFPTNCPRRFDLSSGCAASLYVASLGDGRNSCRMHSRCLIYREYIRDERKSRND